MNIRFLLTIANAILINFSFACDFCGCYMGITPYDNQSSISFLYRYKSFNGYPHTNQHNQLFPAAHQSMIYNSNTTSNSSNQINQNIFGQRHGSNALPTATPLKTQKDYEVYTTAELRVKYFIHQRIELNAVAPLVTNYNRVNENKQTINGVGDITAFAAYHLISKVLTEKYQHRLIIGAGIKLPVGDYYQKGKDNQRIDFLLQTGTGSVDYLTYANYIFGYKKFGFNFNSNVKINGENYYHEKIGNSSTNYLNVFFKFREGKNLKLFPSIQGYYEYSKGLYINNELQPATQMNIACGGVGLDMFYKNFTLNMSFQLPVYEKKYESNLENSCKAMVGLTYSFNQMKYLLKSKKQE